MHDYLAAASGSASTLELPTTIGFNAPELEQIAKGSQGDMTLSLAVLAVGFALVVGRFMQGRRLA